MQLPIMLLNEIIFLIADPFFQQLTRAGNLDILNPDLLISKSTVSTLNLRIIAQSPHFSYPFREQWHCGYRVKLKLICRLTRDRDQALISISSSELGSVSKHFDSNLKVKDLIFQDLSGMKSKLRRAWRSALRRTRRRGR